MLTDKQQAVFDYLVKYIQKNGYGPKFIEINSELGFTSNRSVTQYIETLEEKGLIRRTTENYRNIKLMTTDEHTVKIPILGVTGIGLPIAVDPRLYN